MTVTVIFQDGRFFMCTTDSSHYPLPPLDLTYHNPSNPDPSEAVRDGTPEDQYLNDGRDDLLPLVDCRIGHVYRIFRLHEELTRQEHRGRILHVQTKNFR